MNFKDNQTALRDKLFQYPDKVKDKKGKLKPAYFPGIYFITRDENDLSFKIGMSGKIYKRLLSYKVCFPYKDEMWLQYCIITPTEEDAKKLEKIILKHPKLKHSVIEANPTAQGKRSLEYKIIKHKADLGSIMFDILSQDKYYKLWTHWVPFTRNGWSTDNRNTSQIYKHTFLPKKRLTKQQGLYDTLPAY